MTSPYPRTSPPEDFGDALDRAADALGDSVSGGMLRRPGASVVEPLARAIRAIGGFRVVRRDDVTARIPMCAAQGRN